MKSVLFALQQAIYPHTNRWALVSLWKQDVFNGLSVGQQAFIEEMNELAEQGFGPHDLLPNQGIDATDWANFVADQAEYEAADPVWWEDLDRQAREQDHWDYEQAVLDGIRRW